MPDEDHLTQVEGVDDVEHVAYIAVEGAIAIHVVRGKITFPRAHVVEAHHAIVVLECGRHEAPHVLVAAEAVGEEHGGGTAPGDAHVVAEEDGRRHAMSRVEFGYPVRKDRPRERVAAPGTEAESLS